MVGQNRLKQEFKELVDQGRFPRFSIIIGSNGSGKKEMVKYLAGLLGVTPYKAGNGIADVRQVITEAYKSAVPVLYEFDNADTMSREAKNALLKVTEEPPHQAYFVMTLENRWGTLTTLLSRGTVYNMDPYTRADLLQYVEEHNIQGDKNTILSLCTNIGELVTLSELGIDDFYGKVCKVVDNVSQVSVANALKISEFISFTEEDTGFEIVMFWRAIQRVYVEKMLGSTDPVYQKMIAELISVTQDKVNKCYIKGINKKMLFDMWVFAVREVEDGYRGTETTDNE